MQLETIVALVAMLSVAIEMLFIIALNKKIKNWEYKFVSYKNWENYLKEHGKAHTEIEENMAKNDRNQNEKIRLLRKDIEGPATGEKDGMRDIGITDKTPRGLKRDVRSLTDRFTNMEKTLETIKEQNVFDFTKKTRGYRGLYKLTMADLKSIETMEGTQQEIADFYGISHSRVGQIKQAYRVRMGIKK